MTNEEVSLLKEAILDSTEAYVNTVIERLPFVKTEIGIIEGVGSKKGNKVRLNKVVVNGQVVKEGILYDNVLSVGNIIFPNGSIVYLFVPNAQYNNMFIMGQLDDTPANIKGGTINIGNGAFTVDNSGNVGMTKGSIDINNGKFKVDSSGNADIHGDIKVDGSIKFYWVGDPSEGYAPAYYPSIYLDKVVGDAPSLVFDYPIYCDMGTCQIDYLSCEDINCQTANFYGNVYNSSGGVVFVSDKNAKHDIKSLDLEKSANFIYSQNPVSYKFNDGTSNRNHHGFIAQEVKESMGKDDWGIYIDQSILNKEKKNEVGSIGLRYDEYIADIVATCQYQKQQIDEMKQEIERLKTKVEVITNGNDETDCCGC